jgi:hypothetical protein
MQITPRSRQMTKLVSGHVKKYGLACLRVSFATPELSE